MVKRSIFLMIGLVCCLVSASSQKMLDFDALSIEDGFTSSKAISMLQDRKGYIWIGTWNGLNRYDGYHCEVFKPLHHNTASLTNKEITTLTEDHEGNIWIGTSNGLNCLDPETGTLTTFSFTNRVLVVKEDSFHHIWVGLYGDGLYKIDPKKGTQELVMGHTTVSDVHEDRQGEFWVATYYGLVNLNRQTGSFSRYLRDRNNPQESISNEQITQLAETADGTLWAGTWGGGVNKVVKSNDKSQVKFLAYRAGDPAMGNAYRLAADNYGNLWIGNWNGGVSLLSVEQQSKHPSVAKFQDYVHEPGNPYSLSGNNITALMVDRSGILWVGSSKIDRANILSTGMTRYLTKNFEPNSSTPTQVRSFGGDGNRFLWVGTSEMLKLYENKEGQYELVRNFDPMVYFHNGQRYVSSGILAILNHHTGLWVGTENGGLLLYNSEEAIRSGNARYRFFNNQTPQKLPGDKVQCIIASAKNSNVLYIGTMYSGFAKCVINNGIPTFTAVTEGDSEKDLMDNSVRAIAEDQSGMVWIATNRGLNRYNPQTGEVGKFQYNPSDANSINDNIINVMSRDSKGRLWIGTSSGLNKLEEVAGAGNQTSIRFKNYPSFNHLNNELITNIVEDKDGFLWIGLYLGLVKFDPEKEEVVAEYFVKDFQRLVNERNTAFTDSDGNVLIGGMTGFLTFKPNELTIESVPPKPIITDFLIYNKRVVPDPASSAIDGLQKEVSYCNGITVSHSKNVFTLVFSAMDYKDPRKNQYAYMLEGFDKQWNEAGTRNSATYTSLPHGNYVFKVKASNGDGIWSAEPTMMNVTVLPPWWRTYPAYFLYALVMMGLLYIYRVYALRLLTQRNQLAMERLNYEKEHELNESKSQFFTNITHEFRTPLTLILGPTKELLELKDAPPLVSKQALLIQKNAQRLLRLVNQLMEFRKVEGEKVQLQLQTVDVSILIEEAFDSFSAMAQSRNMKFKLDKRVEGLKALIDADKFDKVVFNLLSNAFKFTADGGEITLRLDMLAKNNEFFCVEVQDNGIGIAADKKELVFNRFYQVNDLKNQSTGGIGLYLSKAFVEQHKGRIELESELGKGSLFRAVFPINGNEIGDEGADVHISPHFEEGQHHHEDELEGKDVDGLPVLLIVEDDSDMNSFIATGLESEFSVHCAFNGREGLELARKLAPDLIVSDVMMPELNGFELIKQLRKDINTSHIPLLFLTAKTMKEDEINGLKLGAVDYITKPFDLTALRFKLKNILKTKTNMQEKLRTTMLLEPEEIELNSLDEAFLKEAVDAVTKNLDNPMFDVELLSKEVGMSSNQVYRKIKSLTGQTAKEFIRSQRLKTAAAMLVQKKRSISEIIYMVGFSSPSYFARCFKEHFGCTPSEYIDQNG